MGIWDKAKGVLQTVAPAIGTAVGGPLGGVAMAALSQALFGTDDATEEDLAAVIARANPDTLLKLRAADQEFRARMRELDIDLERIHHEDRASARRMRVESKSWMPEVLATVFVSGFLGLIYMLTVATIPDANQELVYVLVGALGGGVMTILQFYFGSSAGSSAKNGTIERLMERVGGKP